MPSLGQWIMQFLCFFALTVKWSETKSCKAWILLSLYFDATKAGGWASFNGNFFFICSTTLILLYTSSIYLVYTTSWKGAGHSDTSWEKWTFSIPTPMGLSLFACSTIFLFPRDEPKTWKLHCTEWWDSLPATDLLTVLSGGGIYMH